MTVWIVYPNVLGDEEPAIHPSQDSAERYCDYCKALGWTPSEVIETELVEFQAPDHIWMSYNYPDSFSFWGDVPSDFMEQYYPAGSVDPKHYEGAVFRVEYTGDREELMRRCQSRLDGFRSALTPK